MRTLGSDRRRFAVASLVGGLLAAIPFTWLLCAGRADLGRTDPLGGFYDAQAHSFLDLRWDVPAEVLSVEAFTIEGRSFMYFGPTPALLRLPVAAVTDRFDGRLTQVSMLAAFAVALVSAARLSWRIRTLLLGTSPLLRREVWAAGGFTFLLGAGTSLVFLAGGAIVYHEAIIWGVALALAAYEALLGYLEEGTGRRLAWTAVLACLAILARPSVGLGPTIALGLVLAVRVLAMARARGRPRDRSRPLHLAGLAAACALPIGLQVGVNVAKFGTLFSIPFESQLVTALQPGRTAFLEETGGTLFGLRYLPTTLLHYLRPDGLSFDARLPWIGFPAPADVIGDVPFDFIDRSSSLPATMPWLLALAVGGAVVLVRRRSPGAQRAARTLLAPLAGAAAGPVTTLAIAYIANRYLADFLPLLVLAGAVGLHALRGRARWPLLAGGLLVMGAAACGINLAHGVLFQRFFGPPQTPQTRAELIAWQRDADQLLPGDQSPLVRARAVADRLPDGGAESELVVVGDCAALYQFDGAEWRAVERTPASGGHVFEADLASVMARGGPQPLLVSGDGSRSLTLEPREAGDAVFVFETGGLETVSRVVTVEPGAHHLDLRLDRRLDAVELWFDGVNILAVSPYRAEDDDMSPAATSHGALRRVQLDAPLCRSLRDG